MMIRTNRAALAAALKLCTSATEPRSTMPVLACVLLQARGTTLTVTATDLNVSVTIEIACTGEKGGDALVNAAALSKLVDRMAGDEVTITKADVNIEVRAGKSSAVEPIINARDFPKIFKPAKEQVAVEAAALATVISACLPATCNDETRFHLNGVLLRCDGKRILGVATDGHRLHLRAADCAWEAPDVIVPRKALSVIARLLDGVAKYVEVSIEGSHLFVRGFTDESTPTSIAAKLVDAQYPPFEAVIPGEASGVKVQHIGTVDRVALVDALRRCALVASDSRGVGLDSKGAELHMSATDERDRSAADVLEISVGTGKLRSCAAPSYLLGAVEAVGTDSIAIHAAGELDPLLFAPGGGVPSIAGGNLSVVMPMRR